MTAENKRKPGIRLVSPRAGLRINDRVRLQIQASLRSALRRPDLDRMFGVGLWVRCEDCPATDQPYCWHHRDYHARPVSLDTQEPK